jgi:hypothetical protein
MDGAGLACGLTLTGKARLLLEVESLDNDSRSQDAFGEEAVSDRKRKGLVLDLDL